MPSFGLVTTKLGLELCVQGIAQIHRSVEWMLLGGFHVIGSTSGSTLLLFGLILGRFSLNWAVCVAVLDVIRRTSETVFMLLAQLFAHYKSFGYFVQFYPTLKKKKKEIHASCKIVVKKAV